MQNQTWTTREGIAIVTCERCQAPNPEAAQVCARCGSPLGARPDPGWTGGGRARIPFQILMIGVIALVAAVVAVVLIRSSRQQHAAGPAMAAVTETPSAIGSPTPMPGTRGHESPVPVGTQYTIILQDGDVHICALGSYDAVAVSCTVDAGTVDLTSADQTEIVWPTSRGGTPAATLQLLQRDRAGTWRVVAHAAPNPTAIGNAAGTLAVETFQAFALDANFAARCNATYLIRVVNSHNHRFGEAQLSTTC